MDSSATIALIETLKMINANMEKVTTRIEILENDYKERYYKKQLFKWLIPFYPFFMVILLILIGSDHHKITEITGDVKELINDAKDLAHGSH